MWDLIVSVPDHCLSFYFVKLVPLCSQCLGVVLYQTKLNKLSLKRGFYLSTSVMSLLGQRNNQTHVKLNPSIKNIKSEMRSFKSNENIHKKGDGSYYVVSANKASSVTL